MSRPPDGNMSDDSRDLRRRQNMDAVVRITTNGGLQAATFRTVADEADVSVIPKSTDTNPITTHQCEPSQPQGPHCPSDRNHPPNTSRSQSWPLIHRVPRTVDGLLTGVHNSMTMP
jgi:hypothetical protein